MDSSSALSILQNRDVPIIDFLVNLFIALLLSSLLAWVYRRFGRSLSEKGSLASTFVPITLTTSIIISILQTNIVLSLGLVGALSIIRFRTAIKEPEELSYLFFCIALGLGLGAGQRAMTLSGFVVVTAVLAGRGFTRRGPELGHLVFTIAGPSSIDADKITDILSSRCTFIDLKRLEEAEGKLELSFVVELEKAAALSDIRREMRQIDGDLSWTVSDYRLL